MRLTVNWLLINIKWTLSRPPIQSHVSCHPLFSTHSVWLVRPPWPPFDVDVEPELALRMPLFMLRDRLGGRNRPVAFDGKTAAAACRRNDPLPCSWVVLRLIVVRGYLLGLLAPVVGSLFRLLERTTIMMLSDDDDERRVCVLLRTMALLMRRGGGGWFIDSVYVWNRAHVAYSCVPCWWRPPVISLFTIPCAISCALLARGDQSKMRFNMAEFCMFDCPPPTLRPLSASHPIVGAREPMDGTSACRLYMCCVCVCGAIAFVRFAIPMRMRLSRVHPLKRFKHMHTRYSIGFKYSLYNLKVFIKWYCNLINVFGTEKVNSY